MTMGGAVNIPAGIIPGTPIYGLDDGRRAAGPAPKTDEELRHEMMDRLAAEAVDTRELHRMAGSQERFERVWAPLVHSGHVKQSGGSWVLTYAGQAANAERHMPKTETRRLLPSVSFATLRHQYLASIPAWHDLRRRRDQEARAAREAAYQRELSAVMEFFRAGGGFIGSGARLRPSILWEAFELGWRCSSSTSSPSTDARK